MVRNWDEYDDYAPGIGSRLRDAPDEDAAAKEIVAYLNQVEHDSMHTLSEQHERSNGFLAETLVAWYEWSLPQRREANPDLI